MGLYNDVTAVMGKNKPAHNGEALKVNILDKTVWELPHLVGMNYTIAK